MVKRSLIIGIIIIILLTGVWQASIPSKGQAIIEHQATYNSKYAKHEPICINSDDDFDSDHGVSSGSGIPSDPWMIKGYDINGSSAGYCIYIGNTTEHFVIRDCNLHHSKENTNPYILNSAVQFYNVRNGTIKYTKISNNKYDGVRLDGSDNNTIANSNISSNGYIGIRLDRSDKNLILNTTMSKNRYGLLLQNSTYNDIINVKANKNLYGIWIGDSSKNTITKTHSSYNTRYGVVFGDATHNIINNCTVSWNKRYGIWFDYCEKNIVSKTTVTNNWDGIYIQYLGYNTVVNSTTAYNSRYGIHLVSTNKNKIYHNNFIKNNRTVYDNCNNFWNTSYTKGGNYWHDYKGKD